MLRILLALLILTACAPNKVVYDPPEQYQNGLQNQQLSTATSEREGPYQFISFDLDADFNGIDNTVEAEYTHKDDQITALYKNKVKKVYFAGDAALNELHPMLARLTFSEHSNEADVLEQIITTFDFPNDAIIHLKIEYPSGENRYYTQM